MAAPYRPAPHPRSPHDQSNRIPTSSGGESLGHWGMKSEHSKRPLAWLTLSLAACSAMAVGLLLVRNRATGSISHRFLVWNLALAWIPLGAALLADRWGDSLLRLVAAGAIWLIFFPNSP